MNPMSEQQQRISLEDPPKEQQEQIGQKFDTEFAAAFDPNDRSKTRIIDRAEATRYGQQVLNELLSSKGARRHVEILRKKIPTSFYEKDLAFEVRRLLLRALRAVTKKFLEITDDKKRAILEAIAEREGMSDEEAVFLYEIIVRLMDEGSPNALSVGINEEGEKSPLETEIVSLRDQSRPAFKVLTQVLLDLRGVLGFNEKQINRILELSNESPRQRHQGEMDPVRKEEYENWINKIHTHFKAGDEAGVKTFQDLLHFLYDQDISTYLKTREPSISEEALVNKLVTALAGDLLNNAANPSVELQKLKDLAREFRDTGELDQSARGYGDPDVQEAIKFFNDDIVFKRIFTRKPDNPDGSPGGYVFNEVGVEEVVKKAKQMVNGLFRKVDENPNADFRDMFNDLVEGNIMRAIADRFYRLSDSEDIKLKLKKGGASDEDMDQFYNFVRRRIVQEMYLERNHRELYHNIIYIFNSLTPDKWPSAFSRINISELSILTRDPVINSALELWKNYLQETLIQNDNKIPANFLGGRIYRKGPDGRPLPAHQELYSFKHRDEFIQRLKAQYKMIKGYEPEKWETDRAFSMVKGITALTMEMSAILSNANVTESFDSIPLAEIISRHNPRFMWGWGRGGRPELMKTAAIYMMKIRTTDDKKSFWKRLDDAFQNRWIPQAVIDAGNDFEKHLEDLNVDDPEGFNKMINKLTQYMFDHDTTWYKLIQKVSMGDWLSQGGWRIKGVKQVYEEFNPHKEKWGENWDHIYDFFQEKAGVVLGFTSFAENRAREETLHQIDLYLKLIGNSQEEREKYINKLRASDQSRSEQFSEWGADQRANEVIDGVRMNDKPYPTGKKLSYNEFLEKRLHGIRGRSFYDLLHKDPLAFLNNLNQLMPALQVGKVGKMTAGQFYFDIRDQNSGEKFPNNPWDDAKNGLTTSDKDKWGQFNNYLGERFYTETGTEENRKMLRGIMDFYSKLYDHQFSGYTGSPEDYTARKKYARDLLFKYLSAAHEKAARDTTGTDPKNPVPGRARITREDIGDPRNPNDPDAAFIRELLFHEQTGLFKKFDDHINLHNYFGDGNKDLGYNDLFFQRLAFTWWDRNNIKVVPNGDLNHDLLMRYIDESGEDQFSRTYGAFDSLSKAQNEIMKLYSRLKRGAVKEGAPMFDVLEDILKVHNTIKEIEPYVGQQEMRQIQYYVATVVGHFFQQHWAKRMPFPIGPLAGPLELGFKTSISKILYGMRAPEFTTDQLREYARWLKKEGMLNAKGMWSVDMFLKEIAGENSRFWMTEFAPNVASYLLLFLLFEYIKTAFSEEIDTGGQKKH